VLLSVVQRSPAGGQAGLARFLFGQTAAIRSDDAVLIAGVAGACVLVVAALYKELRLLCFDAAFCAAIGRRPGLLDVLLLTMLTLVTVVGLQAVGLVLIVAMLIIPSLTARFLTDRLWLMMIIAGVVGAVSAGVGGAASAHVARLPAGPAIVSAAAVCLALAAVFAPGKGVVSRWVRRTRATRQTIFEHALRRCYEAAEHGQPLPQRHTRVLARRGLVLDAAGGDGVRLTPEGLALAEQVITRHRLWEAYLVTFGSQAPEHADDPADLIEHLRDPVLIRELEAAVRERSGGATPAVPQSPHALDAGRGRA
jgi:manganese/zinc/iron transport system permease protein